MLSLSRLSLAAVLLALPLVAAQDPTQEPAPAQSGEVEGGGAPSPENIPGAEDKPGDETVAEYPKWVTNDYPCVIGCLQGFNGAETSRDRNVELERTSRECVLNTCNKDSEPMNMYQMGYIIEMFYATGSIYECDGKWCLPEGETAGPVPSGDQPGATSSGDASSAPGATGADGHAATPAVSIPGVNKGQTDTGASTVIETATASGTDSAAADGTSTPAEGAENGAKASKGQWWVGLLLGAMGVVVGSGGLL